MSTSRYTRPLLKLSGEMLGGSKGTGFDRESLEKLANALKKLTDEKITPCIVIGGGNFMRGAKSSLPALRRHKADTIGMLGTVMNAICLSEHLRAAGVRSKVYSALPMPPLVDTFCIDDIMEDLENGVVCIFSAGTGRPYFSTDSGAALSAIEAGCDVLIKGTKVDGVYDSDPAINPNAKKYEHISYAEVLEKELGVMDLVAITLCRDNKMPLKVISLEDPLNILRACKGEPVGTDVTEH